MNVLLQSLERDGSVTRPAEEAVGRVQPTRLTAQGRRELAKATAAVRAVELRMTADLTDDDRDAATRILRSMVRSLREPRA
jgi:DNA-binding MarR family transcriptional regulator